MQRGFTLLELSIVLVLIAVIIGGGLMTLTGSLQTSQFNATVARMDAIEKALLNYSVANYRIPCPSDLRLTVSNINYGVEAATPGTCSGGTPAATNVAASGTVEGGVPTRALKLPDDYMYDGWGRRLRYAVDPAYTAANTLPASVYSPCGTTATSITLNDSTGAVRTTAAVYALISHGADGHGAYTSNGVVINANSTNTDELTNCHCNSSAVATTYTPTYVEKAPTLDPSSNLDNFDDIVTFKDPWQLQAQSFPLAQTPAQCVYVSDSSNCRVEIFNTSGTYVGQFGSCGAGNGQFGGNIYPGTSPGSIAIDSNGNIWVADWANGRVEEFNSSGSYESQFGIFGNPFNRPNGLAIDSSNNIWVSDEFNSIVYEFSSSGSQIGSIGTKGAPGTGNNQFGANLGALAIDKSGNLWVADQSNNRAQIFLNGGYVNQIAASATPDSPSFIPAGFAFSSSGNPLVFDGHLYEAFAFNTSYVYQSTIGSFGSGNGQFRSGAGSMAYDSSGNVWITDAPGNRVEKLSGTGTYILQLGACSSGECSSGAGNGQLNSPAGIAIGR